MTSREETIAEMRAVRLGEIAAAARLRPPPAFQRWERDVPPAQPREITVHVHTLFHEETWESMFLTEAIDRLTTALQSIPPEYRDEAVLSLQTHGGGCDSSTADLDVSYQRKETDDEVRARVQEEGRSRTEYAAMRARMEHEEYLRLKAKYEGGK